MTERLKLAEILAALPLDQSHTTWPTVVPVRLTETDRELIVNVLRAQPQASAGRESDVREACDWPYGEFSFHDEPGEHDPCYVVMPGGAMLPLNHHTGEGVDIARAKFIVAACNEALNADRSRCRQKLQAEYNDLLALQDQVESVPLSKALDIAEMGLSFIDALNEPQTVRETDAYRDTVKKIAAVRERRLAEMVEENSQLRADLAKKRPETLPGMIAEVYGELDAEDCAMIDREWARMRGDILLSNGTSMLTRPAPQSSGVTLDELSEFIDTCWANDDCTGLARYILGTYSVSRPHHSSGEN